ncbi:MAG: nicotinate (nicotinamide) nucleotide adenylyltransferase [Massilibacteroides sp.]|nr:nicotinate (nicotinamide) nucleotide adenylyltransferase [Massilibacteroides sp.]MDD3061321.1 nicotinate (nicotinamide) nucleotide adenylyltransferase [Massilibacteroides sp.]MDD4114919.1 nicotinate (nicotinamide) nucleotide adenylyltransferase [Massilibacteroides sp.]MDD4659817.1 nicotinate (nicotinamide) nucleotide adenylyltransferase [Massilibacteroides sp.]
MIKTGIFPGSFNPIHIGHLALANWMCEYGGLDEVWFLVSPHNPLKEKSGLMDDQFRLLLVKESIASYPKFKVDDIEFSLPQPSYTINTLDALTQKHPENCFYLIIGADNWDKMPLWKDAEKLLNSYRILIYPRLNFPVNIPETFSLVRKVNAPLMEISSSFIRKSLKEGKDIRFFLPETIRPYLREICKQCSL